MKRKNYRWMSLVLVAAILFSACTWKIAETPQNLPEKKVESNEVQIKEPKKTPVTTVPATEEERSYVDTAAISEFLEAIKSTDISTVAVYANSTEEAVASWLPDTMIDAYEIGDCYKETYINEYGYEVTDYYALVKIRVLESGNRVFEKGEGEYRFYGPSATGAIARIRLLTDEIDNEKQFIANVCEKYETLIGVDFEEGNPEKIYEKEHIWTKLREFGYVNHSDICSMDTLELALKDNLGLTDIPWDHSELAYEGGGYEEYERAPKGGTWRFFGITEFTDSECVLEYYADQYGFAMAKRVRYTYSVNENGSICITSVRTIEESEFDEAMGAV